MLWRFVDNERKLWCETDNKKTALQFLNYVKTLKDFEDFTVIRYIVMKSNSDTWFDLSAVIPIKKDTISL